MNRSRFGGADYSAATPDLLRVLLVDESPELLDDIENALWTWRHKLTHASNVDDAVRLCRHLTPSAVLVAVDRSKHYASKAIPALRKRLPTAPIIAIVSAQQHSVPGRFLDQGADAVLLRTDARRPTLHELLANIKPATAENLPSANSRAPKLPMPWRRSEILGALICDVDGKIIDANDRLASWLGYPSRCSLSGHSVVSDLLSDAGDWPAWRQVAGDLRRMISGNVSVRTSAGQLMWMQVEVFSAQDHPSYLQAVFLDQTELAILAAAEC